MIFVNTIDIFKVPAVVVVVVPNGFLHLLQMKFRRGRPLRHTPRKHKGAQLCSQHARVHILL
jgi:hypothetical protein